MAAADFLEAILTPSVPVFVIGALIIIFVPVLLHLLLVRSSTYTSLPSVLLVGPTGSGKTSLLTLLERGDHAAPTRTTQVPQSVELTCSHSTSFRQDDVAGAHTKFLLVDTPGHGKLRHHVSSRLGAGSDSAVVKAVVFVVDAAAISEPEVLATSAAYLYDVLLTLQKRVAAKGGNSKKGVPVLVAANKLDLFTAIPPALAKTKLEGELTRIRSSRSKGLLDSGVGTEDIGSEETDNWLGEYGSADFDFAQMGEFGIDVDVLGGSVRGMDEKSPIVDKWWEWITERISGS